jgi:diaminopimelate decarboxylase
MIANVAGPVCESSDVFPRGARSTSLKSGDLAMLRTAGAYGATMASTYNSRPLVPEVLVSGDKFEIVAGASPPRRSWPKSMCRTG